MASYEDVIALKRRHSRQLLEHPAVSGVDVEQQADGGAAVVVHLKTADAKAREGLPEQLEGHRLIYVVTGEIRKQE